MSNNDLPMLLEFEDCTEECPTFYPEVYIPTYIKKIVSKMPMPTKLQESEYPNIL